MKHDSVSSAKHHSGLDSRVVEAIVGLIAVPGPCEVGSRPVCVAALVVLSWTNSLYHHGMDIVELTLVGDVGALCTELMGI